MTLFKIKIKHSLYFVVLLTVIIKNSSHNFTKKLDLSAALFEREEKGLLALKERPIKEMAVLLETMRIQEDKDLLNGTSLEKKPISKKRRKKNPYEAFFRKPDFFKRLFKIDVGPKKNRIAQAFAQPVIDKSLSKKKTLDDVEKILFQKKIFIPKDSPLENGETSLEVLPPMPYSIEAQEVPVEESLTHGTETPETPAILAPVEQETPIEDVFPIEPQEITIEYFYLKKKPGGGGQGTPAKPAKKVRPKSGSLTVSRASADEIAKFREDFVPENVRGPIETEIRIKKLNEISTSMHDRIEAIEKKLQRIHESNKKKLNEGQEELQTVFEIVRFAPEEAECILEHTSMEKKPDGVEEVTPEKPSEKEKADKWSKEAVEEAREIVRACDARIEELERQVKALQSSKDKSYAGCKEEIEKKIEELNLSTKKRNATAAEIEELEKKLQQLEESNEKKLNEGQEELQTVFEIVRFAPEEAECILEHTSMEKKPDGVEEVTPEKRKKRDLLKRKYESVLRSGRDTSSKPSKDFRSVRKGDPRKKHVMECVNNLVKFKKKRQSVRNRAKEFLERLRHDLRPFRNPTTSPQKRMVAVGPVEEEKILEVAELRNVFSDKKSDRAQEEEMSSGRRTPEFNNEGQNSAHDHSRHSSSLFQRSASKSQSASRANDAQESNGNLSSSSRKKLILESFGGIEPAEEVNENAIFRPSENQTTTQHNQTFSSSESKNRSNSKPEELDSSNSSQEKNDLFNTPKKNDQTANNDRQGASSSSRKGKPKVDDDGELDGDISLIKENIEESIKKDIEKKINFEENYNKKTLAPKKPVDANHEFFMKLVERKNPLKKKPTGTRRPFRFGQEEEKKKNAWAAFGTTTKRSLQVTDKKATPIKSSLKNISLAHAPLQVRKYKKHERDLITHIEVLYNESSLVKDKMTTCENRMLKGIQEYINKSKKNNLIKLKINLNITKAISQFKKEYLTPEEITSLSPQEQIYLKLEIALKGYIQLKTDKKSAKFFCKCIHSILEKKNNCKIDKRTDVSHSNITGDRSNFLSEINLYDSNKKSPIDPNKKEVQPRQYATTIPKENRAPSYTKNTHASHMKKKITD